MNPMQSSYVQYGTGNMLNLDVGTIKRKIDSNEYDDDIFQPNGKRACNTMNNNTQQFATFGSVHTAPQTPKGPDHIQQGGFVSGWSPSSFTPMTMASNGGLIPTGYQTPESVQSSVAASPFASSTDMDMMDMETESSYQDEPVAPIPVSIHAYASTAAPAPAPAMLNAA
ncbi:hypothetical protein BGZ65_011644, partial [Modicella reniformis]